MAQAVTTDCKLLHVDAELCQGLTSAVA